MALIKSTILAQISGSINGMTFAHNRGGAYARNRSLPSNPGTDRQDQVRTAMASISKAWGAVLDESQREAWRIFGSQQQVQNRIGDTITLSGIAAFNRMNLFRMSTLGQAMVEDPPVAMGSQDPPPTFINVNGVLTLEGNPATADIVMNEPSTGYSVAVYYAGPIKPGIKYYRGPYIGHTTSVVTTATTTVALTDLVMPGDDINAALKITLYDTANSLPIWTVFTDPFLVEEGA